jgi:hypothetical protein
MTRPSKRRRAPPAMTSPPWTTYFPADGEGRVKIGRTRNLPTRIQDRTTSAARPLSLLGTIPADVEQLWHARWRSCRIRGEWFTLTPSPFHSQQRPTPSAPSSAR